MMDGMREKVTETEASGRRVGLVILGMIAGALIVQGILRVWVAIELLLTPGIEGQFGGLVRWRTFDQFAGWIGVLILAMAGVSERGKNAWAETVVLAIGLIGMVASLLLGDVGGRAMVEIGVAGLLAIGTAMVAGRQILALARAAGKVGLDVEQLWRGVALQWVLLWVTVEVALRVRFWRDGVESDERARTILFLMPAVAVLPNVMMAMGIRWWGILRGVELGRPRVRAWVLAMMTLNVGAICVVASVWVGWLSVVGAALMIVGVGMYMLGFPAGAWRVRGGGKGSAKMAPAAFGILVVGLGMMMMDGAVQRDLYSAAWRHLLGAVSVLWLIGMGGLALETIVTERLREGTRGVGLLNGLMVLAGVLATGAILIGGIEDRSVVQGLFVGATLQLLGIIVGVAAFLRAGRGLQKS